MLVNKRAIHYDNYSHNNGYVWFSYISNKRARRYVTVGPDDGNIIITLETSFLLLNRKIGLKADYKNITKRLQLVYEKKVIKLETL